MSASDLNQPALSFTFGPDTTSAFSTLPLDKVVASATASSWMQNYFSANSSSNIDDEMAPYQPISAQQPAAMQPPSQKAYEQDVKKTLRCDRWARILVQRWNDLSETWAVMLASVGSRNVLGIDQKTSDGQKETMTWMQRKRATIWLEQLRQRMLRALADLARYAWSRPARTRLRAQLLHEYAQARTWLRGVAPHYSAFADDLGPSPPPPFRPQLSDADTNDSNANVPYTAASTTSDSKSPPRNILNATGGTSLPRHRFSKPKIIDSEWIYRFLFN